MAFDTYAGLQAEVINWYTKDGDEDFAAAVPGFIRLAETMFEQGDAGQGFPPLRTREMEETASISVTNGVGALPTDFLEVINVKSAKRVLEMTISSSADRVFRPLAGQPEEYSIGNGTLTVYPSATETITLEYYQKIPALSDSNTSNWLLAKSPNAYLFGSLIFAAMWAEDDTSMQRYGRAYQQAISGLVSSDNMSKNSRVISRARGYRV